MSAGLYFFEGFIVINGFRVVSQLNNEFRVPIRQEAIHTMNGIEALIIDKVIDKFM